MRYLVDGMNVIGSRPDGWWRDRVGARRRLLAHLAPLADGGHDVTVVFDGRPPSRPSTEDEPDGVAVLYAPGGPNAADDRIAAIVEADPDAGSLVVVTSDADLERRVRAAGGAVEGSGRFRSRLDAPS